MNVAAVAFVEMRSSSHLYHHLIHPNAVSFSSLMRYIALKIEVPLVNLERWREKVSTSPLPANENPSTHLMSFWEAFKLNEGGFQREAGGYPLIEIGHTLAASSTLGNANLAKLGKEDVDKWLTYWGFV